MAIEIERKFLVDHAKWNQVTKPAPRRIKQAYLSRDIHRTVRVRLIDNAAFLTVKGKNDGISRQEFEFEIPVEDAEGLLKLCEGEVIDKERYQVSMGMLMWEVDVFYGENEGLIVAELELVSSDQTFSKPEWVGSEVSDDPRFYNVNLMQNPYSSW
ncbi:MAG: CYTH domain-containing protein [Bacteroidota bacterium]